MIFVAFEAVGCEFYFHELICAERERILQLVPTNGEERPSQKVTTTLRADVLSAKHASFSIALAPILWTSTSIGFALCSQNGGALYRRFRRSSLSSHRWHCPANHQKCAQDKMAGLVSVTSKAQAIQDESVICSRCDRFCRIRRISRFAFQGSCFGCGPWFERALAIGACVLDTRNG